MNKEFRGVRNIILVISFIVVLSGIIILAAFKAIGKDFPVYISYTHYLVVSLSMAFALTSSFNKDHYNLKELNENLEQKVVEKTSELNKKNSDLHNLINIIAHDFKDNISGVLNCFNRYAKDYSPEYEELIRRELTRLTHDMNVMLTARQGGIERIGYDHSTVLDLSAILSSKVKLFRAELENRGDGLRLNADIAGNIYVRADRTALDKILSNLLANAVKYTLLKDREGPLYVNVSLTASDDSSLLTIKDNGIGIKEENREKIFEPFFREFGRMKGATGSGLGLSIVKGAVNSLGGSINVDSEEGKGTTFRLILKRSQLKEGFADDRELNSKIELDRTTIEEFRREPVEGRHNILYVENDLKHIRVFCDEYGDDFNIYLALDGAEAVKMLESIPRPNVIISDIHMPNIDGFGFREAICESYSEIPFIFLTALDGDEIPSNSYGSGAVSIWQKTGLNYELLKLQIRAFCGLAESRTEQIKEVAEKYCKEKIGRIAKECSLNETRTLIFSYMLEGKSSKEIATLLVDNHEISLVLTSIDRNRSEILKTIRGKGHPEVKCVGSLRDFFNNFS